MIILDTHIWVWWVHGSPNLPKKYFQIISKNEEKGLGISIISCWEVAKLVQLNRLELPIGIEEWMKISLNYPGINLLPLTTDIVLESTRLPGEFHKDPADQIIVASSRIYNMPLLTADKKILNYQFVQKANELK